MFLTYTATILGVLSFLFIFWKRLKEDYASSMVFTTSFYVLIGLVIGEVVAGRFFPVWWFWLDLLGISLGLGLGIFRFRLRNFETVEAVVISFLPWLSLVFLRDAIESNSLHSGVGFLIVLVFVAIFILLDKHYKRFTWYKSGKIGFSGATTLGLIFLTRAFIAVTFPNVISFVGRLDAILSAVLAFISFLVVFDLAREKS